MSSSATPAAINVATASATREVTISEDKRPATMPNRPPAALPDRSSERTPAGRTTLRPPTRKNGEFTSTGIIPEGYPLDDLKTISLDTN